MSSPKRKPTVSRSYRAAPDRCADAISLLLNWKRAARPAAPNDVRRVQGAHTANQIIPK
jgi:hypothetical protein